MVLALAMQAAVAFAAPTDVASRLLPKLGQAAGLRLETDRRAGQQVLLIHVKGMDRNRLLKLVAETTGGTWERIEGGYRLGIGAREMEALWREETKAREAWLAKRLEAPSPIASACRLVGAKALAGIRPGQRAVWSSVPNRLQRPLPAGGAEIVRRARAEQQRSLDDYAKQTDGRVPELPTGRTDTILLAARRSAAGGLSAAFAGVGPERHTGYTSGEFGPPKAVAPEGLAARLPAKPISFPAPILASTKNGTLDGATLHPESNEPLARGVGPALDFLAQTAALDLVACIPDEAFANPLSSGQLSGMKIVPFLAEGLSSKWTERLGELGIDARLEAGALTLSPRSRAQAVESRTDRTLLRRRIADVEVEGTLNFRHGYPSDFEQGYLVWMYFTLFVNEFMFDNADWSLPSLWLSLNDAQRDRALRGGLPLQSAPWMVDRLYRSCAHLVGDWPESVGPPAWEPSTIFADPRWSTGALFAEVTTGVGAVFQGPPPSLPVVQKSIEALGARIVSGSPSDPARQKETRYWPATVTHVRLKAVSADGKSSVEGAFAFSTRDPGPATTMPNVFPALRKAMTL